MSKFHWGVGLVAVAMAAGVSASDAGSNFDGSWSVSVRSGSKCEASAHYALRVENGKVSYAGSDAIISGRVDGNGFVRVSIHQSSGHGASGSGHLSGSRGTGIWRGSRAAVLCSGSWEAQRY